MLGRRVQNSRLIEICLQQEDPRVRANAIKSLWAGATGSSTAVLRWAPKRRLQSKLQLTRVELAQRLTECRQVVDDLGDAIS